MTEPVIYNKDDIAPFQSEPREGTKVYEYSMPVDAEVARLLSILKDRGESTDKPYVVYQIDGRDPCSRLARAVELEVFQQYFPSNNETLMQEEYGEFENCTFLLIVDLQSNTPVGMMRLLRNQPSGLKSIIDIESPKHAWKKPLTEVFAENDLKETDLDNTVDVATIAIRDKYQGQEELRAGLFHALHSYIIDNHLTTLVTILDDVVRRHLQRFGCYFNEYQGVGSAPYLDSKASTPCYISFEEMMQRWQQEQPDIYKYVVKGEGLLDQVDMVLGGPDSI